MTQALSKKVLGGLAVAYESVKPLADNDGLIVSLFGGSQETLHRLPYPLDNFLGWRPVVKTEGFKQFLGAEFLLCVILSLRHPVSQEYSHFPSIELERLVMFEFDGGEQTNGRAVSF